MKQPAKNSGKLKGRIALVTGSAKNLGKAIALRLAQEGATLILHFNTSEKEARDTLNEVRRFSPKSIMVQADIMNHEEMDQMMDTISDKFHRLDILVNAVGDFIWKNIAETTDKELDHIVRNNLVTAYSMMTRCLPLMRKNKWGRIISFGSAGCDRIIVREKTTPYYIGKTGLYMASKALAASQAKYGITINMISPGILETSVARPDRKIMPMRRYTSYDDIINALLFLVSDNSVNITGANIEVSGGWWPGYSE